MATFGLLPLLENHSFSTDEKPLCLYGDLAYPLRVHLQAPFRAAHLTPAMAQFNKSMSALRVSVEWLFCDIINYFKFLDFKKDLKIGLSAVGKMYIVCALLQNAITCLYGNNTSRYFQLHPPEINEYFTNQMHVYPNLKQEYYTYYNVPSPLIAANKFIIFTQNKLF